MKVAGIVGGFRRFAVIAQQYRNRTPNRKTLFWPDPPLFQGYDYA
jgi:hypothetical protein